MKKTLMIVVPLLLLGGGFVGLAMAGVVKVPGLTPKKPKPAAMYGEAKDKPLAPKPTPRIEKRVAPRTPPESPAKSKGPERDEEKGAKKLAQLWNTVPTPRLIEVAQQFEDTELAPILILMDPEKVSELIAGLDPKRSARLSRELRSAASLIKG